MDTGSTHIISAIAQIAQEGMEEPWALTFIDHKGSRHYITMEVPPTTTNHHHTHTYHMGLLTFCVPTARMCAAAAGPGVLRERHVPPRPAQAHAGGVLRQRLHALLPFRLGLLREAKGRLGGRSR